MERYTLEEYSEIVEIGVKYKELERDNRLIVLPHPLDGVAYQVIPTDNGKKKVMPCIFTLDMIGEYGKTVFGTETEAIVASMA
jgi:hypothetical protein